MMDDLVLSKEDYEEPRCPLAKPGRTEPIPLDRVIAKLDEYLGRKEFPAAERHLRYWRDEAEASGDLRGKLSILNELIGFYRKTERKEAALGASAEALALAESLELGQSVTMGTTLINAATAYKAFGAPAQALPLYERARTLYESLLSPDDSRLGGLYNNMALALTELGEYRRAEALYRRALEVMEKAPRGALETAITWCNLADLSCAELGQEAGEARISACLDKAQTLLDDDTLPRNAYYAFVCEKCAPTFAYYGFFRAAQALSRRAEEITRQLQRAD